MWHPAVDNVRVELRNRLSQRQRYIAKKQRERERGKPHLLEGLACFFCSKEIYHESSCPDRAKKTERRRRKTIIASMKPGLWKYLLDNDGFSLYDLIFVSLPPFSPRWVSFLHLLTVADIWNTNRMFLMISKIRMSATENSSTSDRYSAHSLRTEVVPSACCSLFWDIPQQRRACFVKTHRRTLMSTHN